MSFHLKIVTAEKVLIDEDVNSFKTSGTDGQFQILTNHSPLIALTVPCQTEYLTKTGEKRTIQTSSGILKFFNNDLLLITDAEPAVKERTV